VLYRSLLVAHTHTRDAQPGYLEQAATLLKDDQVAYEFAPQAGLAGIPNRVLIAHESGCPFFVENVQVRLGATSR
jgi:hypothetical protein